VEGTANGYPARNGEPDMVERKDQFRVANVGGGAVRAVGFGRGPRRPASPCLGSLF
jgi:hypothetical protein